MKGQSKKDVENLCSNSKVQRILNAIDFSRNNKSASGLFHSESLFCSREKIIRAKNTKKNISNCYASVAFDLSRIQQKPLWIFVLKLHLKFFYYSFFALCHFIQRYSCFVSLKKFAIKRSISNMALWKRQLNFALTMFRLVFI